MRVKASSARRITPPDRCGVANRGLRSSHSAFSQMDASRTAPSSVRRGLPNWIRPAAPCLCIAPASRPSQTALGSTGERSRLTGDYRARSTKLPHWTLTSIPSLSN